MTVNLYGYDVSPIYDPERGGSIGYGITDKLLSKVTVDGKAIETLMPKKPEPPKVKSVEFNKQLILKELEKNEAAMKQLDLQVGMVKDLMDQEDADDIYGIAEIVKSLHSFFKEWEATRVCLMKELELSSPISKPAG